MLAVVGFAAGHACVQQPVVPPIRQEGQLNCALRVHVLAGATKPEALGHGVGRLPQSCADTFQDLAQALIPLGVGEERAGARCSEQQSRGSAKGEDPEGH